MELNRVMVAGLCVTASCAWMHAEESTPPKQARPASWAQPIDLAGVPNLHKVSDLLYRSAQPTAAGMKNLKNQNIRTIVNLRSFHSDRDEIGKTGLAYEHIYMKAWHPEEKELVRFLQIVSDPRRAPVLVHCLHGADRTGTMCALYRVAIEGWTKEDALKEMAEGGYGFHGVFENLLDFVNRLDIAEIKRKAGLPEEGSVDSALRHTIESAKPVLTGRNSSQE